MRHHLTDILLASAFLASSQQLTAQMTTPAQDTVRALDDALIALMRSGRGTGLKARAAAIAPTIDRTFDLPLMTRLAAGSSWTTMSTADQTALVAAFRTMTINQYAANFKAYSGQSFTIGPAVDNRGTDSLVRTTLNDPRGEPVAISYRLRQSGGSWKIIDIFYRNAVSQLAIRRSDFAGILASGGAKALIGHLNTMAEKKGE